MPLLTNFDTGKDYDATPSGLGLLDHATLYGMRAGQPAAAQNVIAPYEHAQFVREAMSENPLLSLPLLVDAVGYDAAKAIAPQLFSARSAPSLDSLTQSLQAWRQGYSAANPPVDGGWLSQPDGTP